VLIAGMKKKGNYGYQVNSSRFQHIKVKLTDFTIFDAPVNLIMRRRLIVAIISLIVLAFTLIYLLIPSPLTASGRFSFNINSNTTYHALAEQKNWDKWSPQTFRITNHLVNTVELNVTTDRTIMPVSMLLIPVAKDSTIVVWKATFPQTMNPLTRVNQYSQSHDLKELMDKATTNFQSFVQQSENVYGIHIQETSTKDTFLIATRFVSDSFPSNQIVYNNINKLRSYAAQTGANESGFPMLNISKTGSPSFNCMVALPINKIVDGKGSVFFVRMVPGRFLTTEVKGGPNTISNAHRMMEQYFKDFNRTSMAIPFEYLVTDRLKETDTTKWITRIYGPVY
jgi:hypothetical protein